MTQRTVVPVLLAFLLLPLLPLRAQEAECPDVAVTGVVRDRSTEVALPGASVVAAWLEADGRHRRSTRARDDGSFRLCGLPGDHAVSLHVAFAGSKSLPLRARTPADGELEQPLTLALQGGRPGRMVGRVVDRESGEPVEGARLSFLRVDAGVVSGEGGRFELDRVPSGSRRLVVRHLAYGADTVEVNVPAGNTVDVELRLRQRPIELEPLEVTVEATPRYRALEVRGFYERKRWAEVHGGKFVTPEFLERRRPVRMSHVLDQIPRVRIDRDCSGSLTGSCRRYPVTSGALGVCRVRGMQIWVDGAPVRIDQEPRGIDFLPASSVRAIEIYRGPSEVPLQFNRKGSRCGVVAIWTKTGPDHRRDSGGRE